MDENKIQQNITNDAVNSQYGLYPTNFHTHNGTDSPLITTVSLPKGVPVLLGLGAVISSSNSATVAPGSTSEQIQTSIVAGTGQTGGAGLTTENMQINLLHQPQNSSNQSFITATRPPVQQMIPNTTISVTATQNTLTTVGYGFETNALTGALINIFNSSGILVETQTIASNTATVITIVGTWLNTTSGGTFSVFQPVFFGSADTPFQRLYTQEGTGAGIRFGVGPTNAGQNGLEYMDAAGDLYWRDKSGTSVKLNGGPGSGTVTSVSVANANGFNGSVANATTTPAITIRLNSISGVLFSGDGTSVTGATIPNDDAKYLTGESVPTFRVVTDAKLSISDITTNNVSASAHGFAPKYPNNTTTFLRGDGTYATPSTGTTPSFISALTTVTSSTTQNVDTTFTTGFPPATITIYYLLNGVTSGSNKFSAGTALYDSAGALIVNKGEFIDSAASTGTYAFAFTATAPTSGTAAGTYITVVLSVLSVSATNLVVRAAFTQSGGPTGSAKFVAVVTG